MRFTKLEVFARHTLVVFRAEDEDGLHDEIEEWPGLILRDMEGVLDTHTCTDNGSFLHMACVDGKIVNLSLTWVYGNYACTQTDTISLVKLREICNEAINQLSEDW